MTYFFIDDNETWVMDDETALPLRVPAVQAYRLAQLLKHMHKPSGTHRYIYAHGAKLELTSLDDGALHIRLHDRWNFKITASEKQQLAETLLKYHRQHLPNGAGK